MNKKTNIVHIVESIDVYDEITLVFTNDSKYIPIEDVEIVPSVYLKNITGTDGLYEIRIQTGSDIFRIFCFFDKENLVVIGNGFQKKTQKTPKNEIIKAIQIKLNYEN